MASMIFRGPPAGRDPSHEPRASGRTAAKWRTRRISPWRWLGGFPDLGRFPIALIEKPIMGDEQNNLLDEVLVAACCGDDRSAARRRL